MMNEYVALFCLFLSLATSGQAKDQIGFIVRDSTTSQPITFATVRSADYKSGTYTNAEGVFYLTRDLIDSFYVSSIGYEIKKVFFSQITGNTIYLVPAPPQLQPVLVKTKKAIGNATFGIMAGKKSTTWTSAGYGDEFAQQIIFGDTSKYYKIRTIRIAAERFSPDIPMILHVYSTAEDGRPGMDILSRTIVLTRALFKKSRKQFIVDLSAEEIVINEPSCFIGVEWLPVPSKGQRLPTSALILTGDLDTRLTYTRAYFYSRDKWSVTLSLPGQTRPNNTIISVDVEVLE